MKIRLKNCGGFGPATKGEFVGKVFEATIDRLGFMILNKEFTKQGIIFDKDYDPDDYEWDFIGREGKDYELAEE